MHLESPLRHEASLEGPNLQIEYIGRFVGDNNHKNTHQSSADDGYFDVGIRLHILLEMF